MTRVYIALGSNLDEPIQQVKQAIAALDVIPHSQVVAFSSLYLSKPMQGMSQPDYINAVAMLETSLPPLTLLDQTQAIEQNFGRKREERWGARTLDLDIILYGDHQMNTERLTIPHYGMKVREFVLYPLMELTPELQLPDGTALSELIKSVGKNRMVIIDEANSNT